MITFFHFLSPSSEWHIQSGLLASVAAQLLGTFKGDETLEKNGPAGAKDFLVAMCYAAIFLNINATIGSFVLVDNLGEVGYEAAKRDAGGRLEHISRVGHYHAGVSQLLTEFGASGSWYWMLIHCKLHQVFTIASTNFRFRVDYFLSGDFDLNYSSPDVRDAEGAQEHEDRHGRHCCSDAATYVVVHFVSWCCERKGTSTLRIARHMRLYWIMVQVSVYKRPLSQNILAAAWNGYDVATAPILWKM